LRLIHACSTQFSLIDLAKAIARHAKEVVIKPEVE
jgi:hypothetical protein